MSLFEKLTGDQIIEAVSYFPALSMHPDLVNKALNLKTSIDNQTKVIDNYSEKERLAKLIKTYFKLDAYKDLDEESSLTCWMTQFIARKEIIDQLEAPSMNSFIRNCSIQTQIYGLINNPIIDYKDDDNYNFLRYSPHFSIDTLDVCSLMMLSEPYIKDGTFELFNENYHLLDYSYDDDVINAVKPPSSEFLQNLVELLGSPIENKWQSKAVAIIDLDIDDDQLIEKFSAYLKRVRKEQGAKKPTSESLKNGKRKSWINHRVLQYLDIKILDLYINKEHTLRSQPADLAKLIFPPDDASTPSNGEALNDKIRKTTITVADEIMDDAVIKRVLSDESKRHMRFL